MKKKKANSPLFFVAAALAGSFTLRGATFFLFSGVGDRLRDSSSELLRPDDLEGWRPLLLLLRFGSRSGVRLLREVEGRGEASRLSLFFFFLSRCSSGRSEE